MKLSSAALCLAVAGALAAADAGLMQIRSVYVLPMSGGLDQYLANKLTASGRYQVVTNPEDADAVITDRIGTDFRDRMEELYPPPPPPPEEKTAEEKKAAEEKKPADEQSMVLALGEVAGGMARSSSFTRSRGNIFLVDRGSRRVVWSTYLRPRSTAPDELNRTAEQIVSRLNKDAKRAPASAALPTGTTPPASK
jgi:hypothetical protein